MVVGRDIVVVVVGGGGGVGRRQGCVGQRFGATRLFCESLPHHVVVVQGKKKKGNGDCPCHARHTTRDGSPIGWHPLECSSRELRSNHGTDMTRRSGDGCLSW